MSEPISPDHCSSCALLAGRPASSLAAQRVVAAFALPPPRPPPEQAGTLVIAQISQNRQACCVLKHGIASLGQLAVVLSAHVWRDEDLHECGLQSWAADAVTGVGC